METPDQSREQAPLVPPVKGLLRVDPAKLEKITPGMLRVVQAVALGLTMEQIADQENISVHGVDKRLVKVRGLLKVQSTTAAYRLLLLAQKLELK